MSLTTFEKAQAIQDYVVALRRDFHRHPELSYHENRTSRIVREELEKLGIEVQPVGETGLIGYIRGAQPGKTVALRADMDALPVTEQSGVDYTSENSGVMHACGHDSHTSMLLGAAKLLSEMKDTLKGTVKLVFQPAEELGTGSRFMIQGGALEGIDAIVGMHVSADFPRGKVVVKDGALMASGDQFKIEIIGKQSHGSAPWQGVDANVCAAAILQGFQTIVSRTNDARSPIVLNTGTIRAGDRFNITSGKAVLEGCNRTFSQEIREKLPVWMENMVKGYCHAYGCEYTFDYTYVCAVTDNDPAVTEKVRKSVVEALGEDCIQPIGLQMGSEDFSYYQMEAPGTFLFLGVGNPEKGCTYSLHSDRFKLDEDAFPYGVTCYVQSALAVLG